MESENQTQKRFWIEQIQARYRDLQQKYLGCSDRAEASYLAAEMRLLEAAILGVEQGAVHGICINCSGLIPVERLEALPWTLWCVDCAALQPSGTRSLQELLFPLK